MTKFLSRFLSNESGVAAVEYGLIVAGIAVAIIPIVKSIGADIAAKLALIDAALK